MVTTGKKPGKPKAKKKNPSKNLSAADKKELAKAERLSQTFHGTKSQVIELSAKERKLPRFVVAAGDLEDFTYSPDKGSKRGDYDWNHKSGDRGSGKNSARNKPILAADPETGRPIIVKGKSPMKFSSKRGFVG